jgi:hypothetical protein
MLTSTQKPYLLLDMIEFNVFTNAEKEREESDLRDENNLNK